MVFLIKPKSEFYLFLHEDPRPDYKDDVQEVELTYDSEKVSTWLDGDRRPESTLGESTDGKRYEVFRSTEECRKAGFKPHGPNFDLKATYSAWQKFQKSIAKA